MARKKGGKSKGNISKGERRNVAKSIMNAGRRSTPPLVTLLNKQKAFNEGKRVMVTIPNPSKSETNKPFIRVTAQEAGWKKQMPYRMKQDG